MPTVVKTTSKGQITLPIKWRRKFKTNQFILECQGNSLTIQPLDLTKIPKPRKNEQVIFDAIRDNKGKGIPAREILKILQKLNG
ncbi:MAG: hypothetical protein WCW77_04730 [Patescibacteria group bacterium]|jgi:bifunctional DNA-binding transcriptional regulator/antitoxin component of YhaV-PrlF toxin-antitoxin module